MSVDATIQYTFTEEDKGKILQLAKQVEFGGFSEVIDGQVIDDITFFTNQNMMDFAAQLLMLFPNGLPATVQQTTHQSITELRQNYLFELDNIDNLNEVLEQTLISTKP